MGACAGIHMGVHACGCGEVRTDPVIATTFFLRVALAIRFSSSSNSLVTC